MQREPMPPLIKGGLLIGLFLLLFAGVFSAVKAWGAEPVTDAENTAVTEPAKEKPQSGDIPIWGLHCVREDACLELFTRYFDERYRERAKELKMWEQSLDSMEIELKQSQEALARTRSRVVLDGSHVEGVINQLTECVNTAMEGLPNG